MIPVKIVESERAEHSTFTAGLIAEANGNAGLVWGYRCGLTPPEKSNHFRQGRAQCCDELLKELTRSHYLLTQAKQGLKHFLTLAKLGCIKHTSNAAAESDSVTTNPPIGVDAGKKIPL